MKRPVMLKHPETNPSSIFIRQGRRNRILEYRLFDPAYARKRFFQHVLFVLQLRLIANMLKLAAPTVFVDGAWSLNAMG